MFRIGQEVVCIETVITSDGEVGCKKGKTYIIKGISNYCKCGECLDVGILDYADYTDKIIVCDNCETELPDDGIWWFFSKRFVPVNYEKAKKVEFKKIVEEIPIFSN